MIRRRRTRITTPHAGKWPYIVAASVIILAVLAIAVRQFTSSLFFSPKDRLNVVFYGQNAVYYSLGKADGVDYFVSFYPDLKVSVPGGYGEYRIGGLGKLVSLEKNPDIFRKTFSLTTSSTVDVYFYTPSEDIYYGQNKLESDTLKNPSIREIFFAASNANLFDRLYIFFQFAARNRSQYEEIDYRSFLGRDESFFQDKDFERRYQGYLYNKIYRKEQETVQILYPESYKTALYLSKIIEGDGIRVVDLSLYGDNEKKGGKCQVIESSASFSFSARSIAAFFDCDLVKGKTVSSDIIMKLGTAEDRWLIL